MTTCRIEIEGVTYYNNLCGAQDITISRTQPAAMTPHMMPQHWITFCDRIDDALKPLSKYRKISQRMSLLYLVVFMCVFVYFVIGGTTATTTGSSSDSGIGFMILFVVSFVFFFILFGIQCYGMAKARTANNTIQEICSDVSSQHPNLSFHSQMTNIFYRRRYGYYEPPGIQVSIKNPQAYITSPYDTTVVGGGGIVEATAVVAATSTPAERLAQLDQMKHLISEEEYNNKRNEILESV